MAALFIVSSGFQLYINSFKIEESIIGVFMSLLVSLLLSFVVIQFVKKYKTASFINLWLYIYLLMLAASLLNFIWQLVTFRLTLSGGIYNPIVDCFPPTIPTTAILKAFSSTIGFNSSKKPQPITVYNCDGIRKFCFSAKLAVSQLAQV
ncbi:MAG: hypothetical protein GXO89_02405 [Chlorobi bacterium]|nr:hypothetical protein [Chlorobiota bacterium]